MYVPSLSMNVLSCFAGMCVQKSQVNFFVFPLEKKIICTPGFA